MSDPVTPVLCKLHNSQDYPDPFLCKSTKDKKTKKNIKKPIDF